MARLRATWLVFEFERQGGSGGWEPFGVAMADGNTPHVATAVEMLRARRGGLMPPGSYRVRRLGSSRWARAELDEDGNFTLLLPAN